jgi:hypothetical protein
MSGLAQLDTKTTNLDAKKKILARSAKKIDLVKMRLPKFCPEGRNLGSGLKK